MILYVDEIILIGNWSIDFFNLSHQNTIYNLIHYSRVACTRSKMVLVQTTVI